jgi:probable phosphoglycerate mutase
LPEAHRSHRDPANVETKSSESSSIEMPDHPAPARLLLVRHGESTWNREHRIQGQLDPPLSDRGRRQAELLGQRLGGRRAHGLYSSDLTRAMETAAAVERATGIPLEPVAGLREIFLGEWEGLNTTEIAARFPDGWARWTQELDWDLVPGGEGTAAFQARVAETMRALFARLPSGDAVVVTHGGVIQMVLHSVVGGSPRGAFLFRISNASITTIEQRRGRLIIDSVNDTSHLDGTTLD